MLKAKLVGVALVAAVVMSCSGDRGRAQAVEEGPAVEEELGKDYPGVWRKVCFKLAEKELPVDFDPDAHYDISYEPNRDVAGCVRGFMAMDTTRAAATVECVEAAKTQEDAFWCLESGAPIDVPVE